MTRETKIGLLVGLAFIIVIGILLSDQLMRSTEPPAAPRDEVAENLRRGTTTPASHNRVAAPAVSAQDPSPDNAVPTREEITHRAPPVTWVNVGPGQNSTPGTVIVGGNESHRITPPGNGTGTTLPPVHEGMSRREIADGNPGRSLVDEAAAAGETLIGPDGQPLRANTPLPPVHSNNATPHTNSNSRDTHNTLANGMKQYKAEAGDSLSKLALKQMGANTKANRDAIVKANPSLAADPNKIIIGVTYNIPTAMPTPAVAGASVPPSAPVTPHPAPEHPTAAAAENVYVVKPGDNLTRIAKDHMGDLSTMSAIKELNKETVKNWDVLQVGTKLRLPGKPLASAQ
jgi:LysM repeat protein